MQIIIWFTLQYFRFFRLYCDATLKRGLLGVLFWEIFLHENGENICAGAKFFQSLENSYEWSWTFWIYSAARLGVARIYWPWCKQICVTYDSNALLCKLRLLLFERYKESFETKWNFFFLYESLAGSKVRDLRCSWSRAVKKSSSCRFIFVNIRFMGQFIWNSNKIHLKSLFLIPFNFNLYHPEFILIKILNHQGHYFDWQNDTFLDRSK